MSQLFWSSSLEASCLRFIHSPHPIHPIERPSSGTDTRGQPWLRQHVQTARLAHREGRHVTRIIGSRVSAYPGSSRQ